MPDLTIEEIEAYLDEELPEARMDEIEALASADRELAAKIAVLGQLTGAVARECEGPDQDTADPLSHRAPAVGHDTSARPDARTWFGSPRRPSLLAVRLLVVGAFITLALCLVQTRAAYTDAKEALDAKAAALEEARKSHLTDALETGWLDPTRWNTGRRKVTAVDGYARLNDRGSLVTVQQFKEPIQIDLDWRWIDIAGDISYRDTLTVALHTSGEHETGRPFRVRDGIEVAFQTHSGQVALISLTGDAFSGQTPESSLPIPAGKWHHIRIIDTGKMISVYFSGPAIDKKHEGKPVLTVPYKGNFQKHHIAIYNREIVAGALHESHIRNVTVAPLSKEGSE